MNVEVNWLGVLLATASSMLVGSIWYAKGVFGREWMKLVKLDEKKAKEGAMRSLTLAFAMSFLTAYVLAHVAYLSNTFFGNSFMQDAVSTAFWLWLGFAAARTVTHDAFEGRPMKLTVMNVAHELVTLLVMGVIIGWFHP